MVFYVGLYFEVYFFDAVCIARAEQFSGAVFRSCAVFQLIFFGAVLATTIARYNDDVFDDKDYADDSISKSRLISKTEIPTGPLCPSGWQLFETSCFLKVDKKKRPYYAEKYCTRKNAFLASVDSELEKEFLSKMMNTSNFIIGLKARFPNDLKFGWIDGSTSDYREWAFHEPKIDHKHLHCVYVGGSRSKFYAVNCLRLKPLPFVCKKRIKML
uniref:C-type lectin domain-containing protein n=1 Tax=Syphacia muris TaxID=451379 RepID=A0A0N5ARL4_9BILA